MIIYFPTNQIYGTDTGFTHNANFKTGKFIRLLIIILMLVSMMLLILTRSRRFCDILRNNNFVKEQNEWVEKFWKILWKFNYNMASSSVVESFLTVRPTLCSDYDVNKYRIPFVTIVTPYVHCSHSNIASVLNEMSSENLDSCPEVVEIAHQNKYTFLSNATCCLLYAYLFLLEISSNIWVIVFLYRLCYSWIVSMMSFEMYRQCYRVNSRIWQSSNFCCSMLETA